LKKSAWLTPLSLGLVVAAGFGTKFYRGPGAHWANDSLAGLWYEVFWCLFCFWIRPGWRPARIAAGVLTATCTLEFLQQWHPPWLEFLRSNFVGAAILGTSFDWSDFLYYFAGSGLGWLWLRRLTRGGQQGGGGRIQEKDRGRVPSQRRSGA
jgi:hypothetical protein